MIGKLLHIVVIFFISFGVKVNAKVQLSSNSKILYDGDIFSVEILIEGHKDTEIVRIENIENFNVESQGTSTSYKYINGRSSQEKRIKYELSLKKVKGGKVYLGPVVAKVNGNEIRSNYLVFEVDGKKTDPGKKTNKKSREPIDKYYFMDTRIEDENLFVNQKTLLTLRFYNSVEFAEASLVTPDSKKFFLEQHGKQQNSREVINGRAYKVTTIKYHFTPLLEGALELDGFGIKGLAIIPDAGGSNRQRLGLGLNSFFEDSFFGRRGKRRRVNIKAPALSLKVESLPSSNEGEKFDGVVGQFLAKELEYPQMILSNDSMMFSFIVSGDGNLNLLKFKTIGDDFKIFKEKDESIVLPGGDLQEARRISYLLIPLKTGEISLPTFRAKYFDPTDKLLKEIFVGGGKIVVKGKISQDKDSTRKEKTTSKESEPINFEKNNKDNVENFELFLITDKSYLQKISSLVIRYSNLVFSFSFIFAICVLFYPLALKLKEFTKLKLLVKKKESERSVTDIIYKLKKNNILNIKDIDLALMELLKEKYSPVRSLNYKLLQSLGVNESEILSLREIYENVERSLFSSKSQQYELKSKDVECIKNICEKVLSSKKEEE